jgi:hypothetical protein
VRSFETARSWFEFLKRIPSSEWTSTMRVMVERALTENRQLSEAVLNDGEGTRLPDAVRELMG